MSLPNRFDVDPQQVLSRREHQVFLMIVAGDRICEIAKKLGISNKTVGKYVERACVELRVKGTPGLVMYAYGGGWAKALPGAAAVQPGFAEHLTTAELQRIARDDAYPVREQRLARTCLGLLDRLLSQQMPA